jgi:capsular polysaccharide transport system permease protein
MVDFTAKPIDGCEAPALGTPPSGEPSFWKEESSLSEGVNLQARVVRALILREVRTLYGRHRLGYLWAFFEPITHIGFWYLLWTLMLRGNAVHDMDPFVFLTCGLIPFFCFKSVAAFVQGAISSNAALLQFPPVKQIDTVIARFLLKAATMLVVGLTIFGILIFTGMAAWPDDPLEVILATLAMLLLGLGYGTFNCVLCNLFRTYIHFTGMISRILYFTSGLFFVPETLPAPVLNVLQWNPALHGVELFRSGWSALYESRFATFDYLVFFALVLLVFGLLLEPRVRKIRESE